MNEFAWFVINFGTSDVNKWRQKSQEGWGWSSRKRGGFVGAPKAAADGKAVIKSRHCYCAMSDSPSLHRVRGKDLFTNCAPGEGEAWSLCQELSQVSGWSLGVGVSQQGRAARGARDGGSARTPSANPSSLCLAEGKSWARQTEEMTRDAWNSSVWGGSGASHEEPAVPAALPRIQLTSAPSMCKLPHTKPMDPWDRGSWWAVLREKFSWFSLSCESVFDPGTCAGLWDTWVSPSWQRCCWQQDWAGSCVASLHSLPIFWRAIGMEPLNQCCTQQCTAKSEMCSQHWRWRAFPVSAHQRVSPLAVTLVAVPALPGLVGPAASTGGHMCPAKQPTTGTSTASPSCSTDLAPALHWEVPWATGGFCAGLALALPWFSATHLLREVLHSHWK